MILASVISVWALDLQTNTTEKKTLESSRANLVIGIIWRNVYDKGTSSKL